MNSNVSCERKDLLQMLGSPPQELKQKIPPSIDTKRQKVIILGGPTCSGKSQLAMLLAPLIQGEIVSADSIQLYHGMDIGTAKPTPKERQQVAHHLLDTHEVNEPCNVVGYYHAAKAAIESILARGRVPLVVGGSGFYIHTLLYGPPLGPAPNPELRKALEEEFETAGADLLYERLRQLDLDYANTITKHDKQKIIRALEIIQLSGQKVSELQWHSRHTPLLFDFRCYFLNRPKKSLHSRVHERCDQMVARGLLQEVAGLIPKGIRENLSAAQAIGYRQALDFLTSTGSREDYLLFIEEFKSASRAYIKRQLTWFKRESLFQWIDLDLHDPETVMDLIIHDLEAR